MRLITFHRNGRVHLGLRRRDEVLDLSSAGTGCPASLDEALSAGVSAFEAIERACRTVKLAIPVEEIRYLPPLRHPAKVLCAGLNFHDHVTESKQKLPPHPVLFSRFPTSYVGHGQALLRPSASVQLDYEGEFAAIIGKGGRRIPRDKALEHIAGYSIFNEGSVRDYQKKSHQYMLGKNFDRSGAFGPEFISADELPRGAVGLRLTTRLNGEIMQDANTSDMIFDVAQLIEACSEAMELSPGDVIVAGTPGGVGGARTPPVWMKSGDVCEVEIEGMGILRNPVTDEVMSAQ